MGDLGLNEQHQDQLLAFLKFCRSQRQQRLRALDACFKETEKSRLSDSTYTKDEVKDLLSALLSSVRADMQSELLNTAHTSLLLVRQLCGQAEKWQLNLIVNLSELQNKELLDAVLMFEEQQFDKKTNASTEPSSKKSISKAPEILKKLDPIDFTAISGGNSKLQSEIDRLRQDNEKMRKKLKEKEKENINNKEEKTEKQEKEEKESEQQQTDLQQQLALAQVRGEDQTHILQLQKQLEELNLTMVMSQQEQLKQKQELEGELGNTQQRLLDLNAQLTLTEAELEKKFSKTNAYKTMKQLLSGKNKKIKQMRQKLEKYEPAADKSGEETD